VHAEGSFPFIARSNPDEMVGMPEVDLGVDLGMAGGVQKVGDEREWIAILFSDFVKASEVNAEAE